MPNLKRYKGAFVEYGCDDCGICDSFEEDFTSDISRIKSDSCPHFSLKFIYNLEGDSFKYILSFTCNECGTNQLMNVFEKITEDFPHINYKCINCGKGSMKVSFLLNIKEDIKIYRTADGNNKKVYRTADGNDEKEINNFRFINGINKDNLSNNQVIGGAGGNSNLKNYKTPRENMNINNNNNNFNNNMMNCYPNNMMNNNYNNFNNNMNNNQNININYNMINQYTQNFSTNYPNNQHNNTNNQNNQYYNMNNQNNQYNNMNNQNNQYNNMNNLNNQYNNMNNPNYKMNNRNNMNYFNNNINNIPFNNINNKNNININNNRNNNINNNEINIFFINDEKKIKINVKASPKATFKDIMLKVVKENADTLDLESLNKFLYKGKDIDIKKTLEDIGIKDGDEIQMIIED